MKVEKVHLVEVDDSLKLLQPSRSVEIRTDKGTIVSPTRCATSYEFNRKSELPTETTLNNPISVYSKKFTGREVAGLLTTNSEYGKQLSSIERIDRMTEYSLLHVCCFQLSETSQIGPSPMEILNAGDNLEKFLRFLIDMQFDAKHEIISIPHLNLPITKLKKILSDVNSAIVKLGKQPIFSIDLRYPNFSEILEHVHTNFQSQLINLIYRKRREVPQHYDILRNYARKDSAFLMSNVDRIDFNNDELSAMHYMPFLGNDFFAVEIPAPNITKPGAPKKDRNILNLKILKSDDLTVVSLANSGISNEQILQEIGNPSNDELDTRLNNIEDAKTDNDKYKILNALTRVQELKASTHEFSVLSDHVKERSSVDYVKSKNNFENRLSKLT